MDVIERRILFAGRAIVTCLDTTDIVNKAIEIHSLSELAAAALGRTLTMGAFISAQFKSTKHKLTIMVEGDGPLGKIIVLGDYCGKVRGYLQNPTYNLPIREDGKIDVGNGVGKNGTLTVIKDFGLKEPYGGKIELVSGEIAEDFTKYFLDSEQLHSAVALGVLIKNGKCEKAGGLIVQAMPNCTQEQLVMLEDSMVHFSNISSLLKEKSPKEILDFYYEFFEPSVLESIYPVYECSCSRERVEQAIQSLGKKEALAIVDEIGYIESTCQFCNKKYIFGRSDVKKIFERNK